MPRVAIFEVACSGVQNPREHRHEQRLRVLPGDFRVRFGEELVYTPTASKRCALAQRLAHRHENACLEALPGYVSHKEKQPVGIEHEEIVEISTDFAGGLHR